MLDKNRIFLSGDALVWFRQGLSYAVSGEHEQAITCYNKVLQTRSDFWEAWYERGLSLESLGRYCDAIASYDRALALKQDNNLAWMNRGAVLMELQRFDEAFVSYDRACSLYPDDPVAQQARGLAAEQVQFQALEAHEKPTEIILETEAEAPKVLEDTTEIPHDYWECPVLVVEDDAGQREIALNGKLYTIGRDPKNDVYLRSQFVSRFHAILVQVDRQTYRIVDGDLKGTPSTNGILINGQRKHSCELQTGDLVIFGPQARAIYRAQIQPLSCD